MLVQKEIKAVYLGENKVRPSATPITTAGIYRNETDGLISLSSDGTNWITIADKNLGATTVWNSGDALSEANCGKYYQRGNNYGFPFTGTVTTSSTQVDASNYGPGNYYNSSTWITINPRDYSDNRNLRGGTTRTVEAMKGPCDTGFHLPLDTERQTIYSIWTALGRGDGDGTDFGNTLKIPFPGYRARNATIKNQGINGTYWASSRRNSIYGNGIMLAANSVSYQSFGDINEGHNIRPFKNEAVQPDSSRTKLN